MLLKFGPEIEEQLSDQTLSVKQMGREATQEVLEQAGAELAQLGIGEDAVQNVYVNVVDTLSLNNPAATFTIEIVAVESMKYDVRAEKIPLQLRAKLRVTRVAKGEKSALEKRQEKEKAAAEARKQRDKENQEREAAERAKRKKEQEAHKARLVEIEIPETYNPYQESIRKMVADNFRSSIDSDVFGTNVDVDLAVEAAQTAAVALAEKVTTEMSPHEEKADILEKVSIKNAQPLPSIGMSSSYKVTVVITTKNFGSYTYEVIVSDRPLQARQLKFLTEEE